MKRLLAAYKDCTFQLTQLMCGPHAQEPKTVISLLQTILFIPASLILKGKWSSLVDFMQMHCATLNFRILQKCLKIFEYLQKQLGYLWKFGQSTGKNILPLTTCRKNLCKVHTFAWYSFHSLIYKLTNIKRKHSPNEYLYRVKRKKKVKMK